MIRETRGLQIAGFGFAEKREEREKIGRASKKEE